MPPIKKKTNTVQNARGRLKGALHDVIAPIDDENDDTKIPLRGRPPKRYKKDIPSAQGARPTQQSFIMKLFERSLDLVKFREKTALYPVCRAWMVNQPRSETLDNFENRKTPSPERRMPYTDLLKQIMNDDNLDIHCMPAEIKNVKIQRIPSPLPFQRNIDKGNIDLDYDLDKPSLSRADLLADIKAKSTLVRQNWQKHIKHYQEAKYSQNLRIIEAIYKPI